MTKISLLLAMMCIGFVLVALPDNDKRLFSISRDHGPSLLDTVGLVLGLFAYTWLALLVWKRKEKLLKYQGSRLYNAGLFLSGTGLGLVIASVMNDHVYWWMYGVILLVVIQAVAFYIVLRKR